jgi:LysM repeat protein
LAKTAVYAEAPVGNLFLLKERTMMRTLSSGVLCLTLLACLLFFTACGQMQEDQLLVENRLNEFSKDFKVMKADMADLEMEIEVLNEQLEFLRLAKTTGGAVDDKQLKNLENRMVTMESSLSDVKMRAASVETRTATVEKATASLSKKVAELPKQLEAKAAVTQAKAQPREPASAKAEVAQAPSAAAPAPANSRPTQGFYYTLQRGDSIESVATTLDLDGQSIRAANRVPEGFQPLIGQRIYIPTA